MKRTRYCMKYENYLLLGVKILWKRTISTEFLNYVFPQNFKTRKLAKISDFYPASYRSYPETFHKFHFY